MTFEPKYTITDKTLNNLTLITSAREVIEQSSIVPKWEAKLRRQALLTNTHSSTAIEGNKLTLAQVEALSQGKEITAANKDKQEVLNYLEALNNIPSFSKAGQITIQALMDIHRIICNKTLADPLDCGVFRNRQVYVGKHVFEATGFREEIAYLPPLKLNVQKVGGTGNTGVISADKHLKRQSYLFIGFIKNFRN